MKWPLHWGKSSADAEYATLEESRRRLAEAEQLVADAQPTIQAVKTSRRQNRLSESVAAALDVYGGRA